jgi:hypothetical protein
LSRTATSITQVGEGLLFLAGLALLAALALASAWPDMEATVFDSATASVAGARLGTLHCPWMVTEHEAARLTATFRNQSARSESFLVRARISEGSVAYWRQASQVLTLAPGEARTLSWPVTADDAAYGRLILARVLAMGAGSGPARQAACGILILHVPGGRGDFLFALGLVCSGGLMALGLAGWAWRRRLAGRSLAVTRAFGATALVVAASLAVGMLGWWLPSHLLLILSVIVLLAMLEGASESSSTPE